MSSSLKALSLLAVVAIGVAAPVKVRIDPNVDGLPCKAGVSVTANEASADTCWCEYKLFAAGCTSPNYRYVCLAEFASKSEDVYPVEHAAWLLNRPER